MSKREVWVVEWSDGEPLEALLSRPGGDKQAVRYVPESTQPAERDGEWVSCGERLPKTAEAVLVFGCGLRRVAWKSAIGWYGDHDALLSGVTHWMPLPAPPQPKGTK